MIDVSKLRENPEEMKQNLRDRQLPELVDRVDRLLELDVKRRELIQQVEGLRARRNELSSQIVSPEDTKLIGEASRVKGQIKKLEPELESIQAEYRGLLLQMPNWHHPEIPVGADESENVVVRKWGEPSRFGFTPRDHLELGKLNDWIDFDRGSKVSGSRFYFLKNEAVILENAIIRYGLDFLRHRGFTLFFTPDIARDMILEGIGFQPRGDETEIFSIEGTDKSLVGTAEVTLGGYHAGDILFGGDLPLKLGGFSHCFRAEAGGYGKYSKGLYRVHQFAKVEMFIYCLPEESDKMHQYLLALEEEIYQELGLPYQVVEMCTGDLGAPAYRKYDLEAWMPGREGGAYGEVTSTSNTWDYQARRLNIRYRDEDGKVAFTHMLNGTAVTTSRTLLAILENYQQEDGSVRVPEVLRSYVGSDIIAR